MASRLRKRVGNYYLGRTLGEGTYAKVKYGQHAETGEAVAIKILDKERLAEAKMEGQIKREIHILKHLHHPNIVDLKEVMASKQSVFMVMELVPGGELFDHILVEGAMKRSSMRDRTVLTNAIEPQEERAKQIFCQLLDGLEYCHLHKIFHRDLKPENVLLTSEGGVKLSDFGLGALPTTERENGMLATTCGTPNYVAPEVLARKGYAGGPADIWSLGVLLYVISSGKLPFEEMDLVSLFHKISRAAYKKPPWFSDELNDILNLMLQPDPSRRASFAVLRAHPWICNSAQQQQKKPKLLHSLPIPGNIFQPTVVPRRLTQEEASSVNRSSSESKPAASMNAFELLTSALDLSALFEKRSDVIVRTTRFTSKASPTEIFQQLEKAIARLGGAARKRNASRMKLTAGQAQGVATASVEVIPVLPGVHMVEFARSSGSSVAFHELFKRLLGECSTIVAS